MDRRSLKLSRALPESCKSNTSAHTHTARVHAPTNMRPCRSPLTSLGIVFPWDRAHLDAPVNGSSVSDRHRWIQQRAADVIPRRIPGHLPIQNPRHSANWTQARSIRLVATAGTLFGRACRIRRFMGPRQLCIRRLFRRKCCIHPSATTAACRQPGQKLCARSWYSSLQEVSPISRLTTRRLFSAQSVDTRTLTWRMSGKSSY